MAISSSTTWLICLALLVQCLRPAHAFLVAVEGRECFSHMADHGDTITGSFVVVDMDSSWRDDIAEVEFSILNPRGETVYHVSEREEDNFEFGATQTGLYQFCLEQKSHHVATIELNFQVGHVSPLTELATDAHMAEIIHDLQTIRINLGLIEQDQAFFKGRDLRRKHTSVSTNRRMFYYALLEAVVLVGASVLQVYVLRSLFERQAKVSRA